MSSPRSFALCALLCTLVAVLSTRDALAQPEALRAAGPTGSITLPPTGAALIDEATAPALNPAGLAFVRGPGLVYLHERNIDLDLVSDGLFLGVGFEGLSLGFSPQWVRPGGAPDYRKTQWTLALGGEVLALGASLNLFASEADAELDRLSTWDLGLTLRPFRYLSVGASVLDVDGDSLGGRRLPRRYDVGIGLRPFTDRLVLGADLLVDDVDGFDEARLAITLQGEPVEGLVLLAGVGRGLSGGDLVGQFGLVLNTPNFGAGYALGVRDDLGRADHLVQVRLSSERYRSLPVAGRRYVVVDLEGALEPAGGPLAMLLGASGRDPYLELLGRLRRLREDETVAGIVLKLGGGAELGLARFQELRDALQELRGAGKKIAAYFLAGEDGQYLLASTADRIYAPPQAAFIVNGLSASSLYFGEALERLGVKVDVARVGQYKSAPDQFTRPDMSEEEREMLDAYLDSVFPDYLAAVSKARNIPPEKLREAIDRGIFSAQLAKEVGLIDEIVYPDELPARLESLEGRSVDLVASEEGPATWPRRWGTRPKIAIVPIQGLITEGQSRPDLGGSAVAGADTVIRALEKVLRDDAFEALVLRIDSGGGSTLASDLIWRAVKRVQEKKPVVVSMGDVAASGGYYVAVAGDEILAEPATITGSIGVFALKPSFNPLLRNLGINSVVLKRGDSADLFSLTRAWTPEEQEAVQQYVQQSYEIFIEKVAEARKLDKQRVDELGRGRIWSGKTAKELGLIDALGGLYEALARARSRAGLTDEEVDVEVIGGGGLFDLSLLPDTEASRLQGLLKQVGLEHGLQLLELQDEPLSLMPWKIEVR